MFALVFLAVGLAMDAVAVALVRGATGEHRPARALEVAAFFGVAQGVMPLIGWAIGVTLAGVIAAFDHWIAFALLGFLGLRMLHEAFTGDDEAAVPPHTRRTYYAGLAVAAIATSIDAAAAGITLPLLGQPLGLSCLIIGATTAALCLPAYWLGTRASPDTGKAAEVLGGLVLIGLGIKILVEHLGA
ncbi:manganese efflux pump MntP [Aurantiacibacter poecillastricola]|uniref:manganese efflux pump MntP n=1 Tax=Aurantiacibacter poecillastricola TaxID=3064385 RepID=UPI00273E63BB|nr:manganese efflux pump MntP family protein [Aurantiacibacter sp. 219JJ12-13]MDP5260178.1 manganese efflux pump MntP family protein [Aurantiacibacter sp. 219JJ12-13]